MVLDLKVSAKKLSTLAALALASFDVSPGHAQITNWQNGLTIPGTEHLEPGPRLYLESFNTNAKNLRFAALDGKDLRESTVSSVWMESARLRSADLRTSYWDNVRLQNADLSHANLEGMELRNSDLRNSLLVGANLSRASLTRTRLQGADMSGAEITGAMFGEAFADPSQSGTDLTKEQLYSTASYQRKDLSGIHLSGNDISTWDFTGQTVTNAEFNRSKLKKEQLYSTASYQAKNLRGISLRDNNDLRGWDFTGQDLTGANLGCGSQLSGAIFTDAVIAGVNFDHLGACSAPSVTLDQIYSTASYKQKNLQGIGLRANTLRNIDLSGQDLRDASLAGADVKGANLTGAWIHGTHFNAAERFNSPTAEFSPSGLTRDQFYSTASYQAKTLPGIYFYLDSMNGWNLQGQDLSGSAFQTDLRNVDFTDAIITGVAFQGTQFDLTSKQLYSTASYQQKQLKSLQFYAHRLDGWNFVGQDLRNTSFSNCSLVGADFTDAIIQNVWFGNTSLSQSQLYSTASYRNHDLQGVSFFQTNFVGWDFRGQNLSHAVLGWANLLEADLTDAVVTFADFTGSGLNSEQLYSTASFKERDLRGMFLDDAALLSEPLDLRGQRLTEAWFGFEPNPTIQFAFADLRVSNGVYSAEQTRNAILSSGHIDPLDLKINEALEIHDYVNNTSPWLAQITVQTAFAMEAGSRLKLLFGDEPWGSTIQFESGIPIQVGGTLELTLDAGVNLEGLRGKSMKLFDWTGVQRNGQFAIESTYLWDLSNLYTTGVVTFLGTANQTGDFDKNGRSDEADVNLLLTGIRQGTNPSLYDITADGRVDSQDLEWWVHEVRNTYFGDANLDGQLNSSDLVAVFAMGTYEDAIPSNANWESGDWNGDGEFSSADLVLAFQDGGYEQGNRPAVAAVPEPSAIGLIFVAGLFCSGTRRLRSEKADRSFLELS